MLNQQIISPEITPLHPDQTVEEALLKMEDLSIQQLPVVNEGRFEGLIAEDDLLDADSTKKVGELQLDFHQLSVNAEDHFLTAAQQMASKNIDLVPVVAANNEYVGTIDKNVLFRQLANLTGVLAGGAMVVLNMEPHQFSISELSKLVETNDAHITQLNTATDELSGNLIVTLRINKQEVSDIIATLQRYEYHVAFYSGEEHYENEIRRNYSHLMNFLTM